MGLTLRFMGHLPSFDQGFFLESENYQNFTYIDFKIIRGVEESKSNDKNWGRVRLFIQNMSCGVSLESRGSKEINHQQINLDR